MSQAEPKEAENNPVESIVPEESSKVPEIVVHEVAEPQEDPANK